MGSLLALPSILCIALLPLIGGPYAGPPGAETLHDQLAEAYRASRAPAMAAGVVDADGQRRIATIGERAAGTGVPVEPDDLWHIGSISKSFTAILAARLVDEGLIRWDTTIIEAIPSLEPRISRLYHRVTLEQLLSSRAGVPPFDPAIQRWLFEQEAPIREQRLEASARILNLRPVAPPGAWHEYSNFGFIVAGAMLEHAGDASWEQLILRHIAEPLRMPGLGYGAPGDPMIDAPDQPWGHLLGPERAIAVPPAQRSDNPPAYAPAGTIHASIADLTNYAEAMLGTLLVLRDPATKPDTPTPLGITAGSARHVFRVPSSSREGNPPYALGLVVSADESGTPITLWHNGSNTMWYAEMLISTPPGGPPRAAFVCANAMGDDTQKAVAELARLLVAEGGGGVGGGAE